MKTFCCDFGDGVSCKTIVEDACPRPKDGFNHIRGVEWSGKTTVKHLRPYIAWMNSVNQTLANEWGVKLMHTFGTKPGFAEFEIWVYEPGGRPKKVMKK
jgi:hypothetical protein